MIEFPPINRGVSLLNKLLGLKTSQSPNALSQLVQPVTDLLPWWALSEESQLRATQAVGIGVLGPLAPAALNVPATSRWLLTGMTIRATTGAGVVFVFSGMYFEPASGRVNAIGPVAQVGANQDVILDCLQGSDLRLIPPAAQLGVQIHVATAAAGSCEIIPRFVQFEA